MVAAGRVLVEDWMTTGSSIASIEAQTAPESVADEARQSLTQRSARRSSIDAMLLPPVVTRSSTRQPACPPHRALDAAFWCMLLQFLRMKTDAGASKNPAPHYAESGSSTPATGHRLESFVRQSAFQNRDTFAHSTGKWKPSIVAETGDLIPDLKVIGAQAESHSFNRDHSVPISRLRDS